MKNILPERLSIIRATLSLLYRSNPRASLISSIASIPEPLFYPTIFFPLQKVFKGLSGSRCYDWLDYGKWYSKVEL